MGYDPDNRRRTVEPTPPVTAKVVRVDTSGAWAVQIGEDARFPLGPLLGSAGVTVDDVVLLVHTDEGTWVAGRDTP